LLRTQVLQQNLLYLQSREQAEFAPSHKANK
jgi:hypothetical protein